METNQNLSVQSQAGSLTTINSKPLLLSVLVEGDTIAVKNHLALYKVRGMVSYRKVLELPLSERIPALIEQPGKRAEILTALSAALKSAFGNINVRLAMNEDQVVELADMIIDQSHEDQLGIEDVLLFLCDLLQGKMGRVNDRMDIPTFFTLFEEYRQRRHLEMKGFRDELDAQHRALPVNDRFVHDSVEEERDKIRSAVGNYLKQPNIDQEA